MPNLWAMLPIRSADDGYLGVRVMLARQGIIVSPDQSAEVMIHSANLGRMEKRIPLIPVPQTTDKTKPVRAFVNSGRWIAQCECASAALVSQIDKRFFCIECLNVSVGSAWRPVEWPAEPKAIEELLSVRPTPQLQNWIWSQPVADLKADNDKHRDMLAASVMESAGAVTTRTA